MALWDDLLVEVGTLTNRPFLVAETAISLRQAVRKAHASGRFWRDLVEVPVTSLAVQQVQEISLDVHAPRFRQAAYIKSNTLNDVYFNPVAIDDLLDADNYSRTNVYWGFGNVLRVRAQSIEDNYTLGYYQYPVTDPATFTSWIVSEFRDLIVVNAALNVLGLVGEQEIKGTLERLAASLRAEFIQQNLEVAAR